MRRKSAPITLYLVLLTKTLWFYVEKSGWHELLKRQLPDCKTINLSFAGILHFWNIYCTWAHLFSSSILSSPVLPSSLISSGLLSFPPFICSALLLLSPLSLHLTGCQTSLTTGHSVRSVRLSLSASYASMLTFHRSLTGDCAEERLFCGLRLCFPFGIFVLVAQPVSFKGVVSMEKR